MIVLYDASKSLQLIAPNPEAIAFSQPLFAFNNYEELVEELRKLLVLSPDICFAAVVSGRLFTIRKLIAHAALYVDHLTSGDYEDRYCLSNVDLAVRAIEEYKTTGEVRYWQKHHNQRLRVIGDLMFHESDPPIPECSLRCVPWNTVELKKQYPYDSILDKL